MVMRFLEEHYTVRNIIHAAFYVALIIIAITVFVNLHHAGENVGAIFIVALLSPFALYLHLTKHAGATVIMLMVAHSFTMVILDWKSINPELAFYHALLTSCLVALLVTYYSLIQRTDLEQA